MSLDLYCFIFSTINIYDTAVLCIYCRSFHCSTTRRMIVQGNLGIACKINTAISSIYPALCRTSRHCNLSITKDSRRILAVYLNGITYLSCWTNINGSFALDCKRIMFAEHIDAVTKITALLSTVMIELQLQIFLKRNTSHVICIVIKIDTIQRIVAITSTFYIHIVLKSAFSSAI